MPHAHSEQAQIHYTVSGTGEQTLLMLMGLGGNATEWGQDFPAELARHMRVVRMDNRGIGASHTTASQWSMADMARDALAVLDALGVSQAHVLGTSMGGMIAQTLAIEHPQRVSKLVLICTHFGGAEAVPPNAEAAALFAPARGMSPAEIGRRTLRTITAPGFAERRPDLIELMIRLREQAPTKSRVFRAQIEALLMSDRSQQVAQIACPTLVVHGVDDSLIPVENGKQLAARIPNAQLCLLEGCGHMPYLELPEVCAETVLDFLRGSDTRGA